MENDKIYLFRLRLFDRPQGQLFQRVAKKVLLEESFANNQLSVEANGSRWRYGNFKSISSDLVFFRVGKVKTEKNERFIEGDFDEEELEKGVSTKVLFDVNLGLLAIFQSWDLAQHAGTIAKRIVDILESNPLFESNGYVLDVEQIRDPRDFILMLQRSIAIKSVEINYKGRNPPDIGMLFHEQLEASVDALKGRIGQTTITGDYLDKQVAIEIARSTAQTGDSVSAKIQEYPNNRATWKHMSRSNFLFVEVAANDDFHDVIYKIYETYKDINNED